MEAEVRLRRVGWRGWRGWRGAGEAGEAKKSLTSHVPLILTSPTEGDDHSRVLMFVCMCACVHVCLCAFVLVC